MKPASCFGPAHILLPREDIPLEKWGCVACDQFTSDRTYWERADAAVGSCPSTLRLILPEVYLGDKDAAQRVERIHAAMDAYSRDVLTRAVDGFVYVERTEQSGRVRQGLVGKIDLEAYSYEKGSRPAIRPSERTVTERIPPRMTVRRGAALETPHVMMLADDPGCTLIEPIGAHKSALKKLYEGELMQGGGHIAGWAVEDPALLAQIEAALAGLGSQEAFDAKYPQAKGAAPLTLAVGDGNHSLAAAKACWEELKPTLSEAERQTHPARYALVELVNLHDDSLEFEPIHRVLFGVDPKQLLADLLAAYPGAHYGAGEGHQITYVLPGERGILTVPHPTAQLEVGTLQTFLDQYLEAHGGKIDYIHGEDVVEQLVQQPDSIGFLLPGMGKDQLFPTVIFDGALPRKTFSMGEAHDKRFYLEARKIK